MIFFDIDDTLLNNTAAELDAARKFYRLHKNVIDESPDEFQKKWRKLTEKNIRRYLAGELTFQGQRRGRLRQLFSNKVVLSDAEADVMFDLILLSMKAVGSFFRMLRNA